MFRLNEKTSILLAFDVWEAKMKAFSHEVILNAPIHALDLADWIFAMSEEDYRACARGHEAMGTVGGARRLGVVNVETIAGTLIVQHYRTQLAQADQVSFLSAASKGFLLHVIPFLMAVSWEMTVVARSEETSTFRCTIGFKAPTWVTIAGTFNANDFWLKHHLVEETGGFAADIERKLMSGSLV